MGCKNILVSGICKISNKVSGEPALIQTHALTARKEQSKDIPRQSTHLLRGLRGVTCPFPLLPHADEGGPKNNLGKVPEKHTLKTYIEHGIGLVFWFFLNIDFVVISFLNSFANKCTEPST